MSFRPAALTLFLMILLPLITGCSGPEPTVLNSIPPKSPWESIDATDSQIGCFSLSTDGKHIFCLGNVGSGEEYKYPFTAFSIETGEWTRLPEAPFYPGGVYSSFCPGKKSVVAVKRQDFSKSGFGKDGITAGIFSLEKNTWKTVKIKYSGLGCVAGLARWGKTNFLVLTATQRLNRAIKVAVLDPFAGTIEILAQFPDKKAITGCLMLDNRLYVLESGQDPLLRVFDPGIKKWVKKIRAVNIKAGSSDHLFSYRGELMLVSFPNYDYRARTYCGKTGVYHIDRMAGKARRLHPSFSGPKPRGGSGGICAGDRFYLLGGVSRSYFWLSDMDCYHLNLKDPYYREPFPSTGQKYSEYSTVKTEPAVPSGNTADKKPEKKTWEGYLCKRPDGKIGMGWHLVAGCVPARCPQVMGDELGKKLRPLAGNAHCGYFFWDYSWIGTKKNPSLPDADVKNMPSVLIKIRGNVINVVSGLKSAESGYPKNGEHYLVPVDKKLDIMTEGELLTVEYLNEEWLEQWRHLVKMGFNPWRSGFAKKYEKDIKSFIRIRDKVLPVLIRMKELSKITDEMINETKEVSHNARTVKTFQTYIEGTAHRALIKLSTGYGLSQKALKQLGEVPPGHKEIEKLFLVSADKDDFLKKLRALWKGSLYDLEFYYYGAGCLEIDTVGHIFESWSESDFQQYQKETKRITERYSP